MNGEQAKLAITAALEATESIDSIKALQLNSAAFAALSMLALQCEGEDDTFDLERWSLDSLTILKAHARLTQNRRVGVPIS